MKRNFTKLLIISIICAIITIFFCFISIKYIDYHPFSTTEGVINEVIQKGSGYPGAGWYLLFAGGTALFIDFGFMLTCLAFVILIPAFIWFLVIVLQGIARLMQIGIEKKWKNTTSKVLTYISMSILILLCLELVYMIFVLNNMLLVIALFSSIVGVVLFIKELKVMKTHVVDIVKKD